jgi:hypothetical protein
VSQPVDRHGLAAALRLFVDGFVVEAKRTQIHARLLAAERRAETLGTLPRWLAARTSPLEGKDRSPAGLAARFGELLGVQLTEDAAARTTIGAAVGVGRARASLFVADSGRLALITVADGPPILCAR